ncbi:DNA polymerase I [Desulfovibrio litoralis]|uniref:DNA polymerase I n=1 Tax=Desulfovibrio litoralis DSM 11393 TaxID=1121455 RepID=A0A1M7T3U6_9BACT|nr:DNA polymerase I [Desulfovibrio litoralis]SHN65445.1 DNA polymerase I [Desulfovibrio litoralis DSM 11393]
MNDALLSHEAQHDKQSDSIYLIDGSAFIHRAFYAQREMTRSDGFPTNILFIVSRLILKILRERRPKRMVFVVDGKGKNFRHELYQAYKANRTATPEQLILQIEPILNIIQSFGITTLVSDKCEADDCLASMAKKFSKHYPVVLVGADKDLKQCITENIVLWDPSGKDERLTTLESFIAETGFKPTSWPDYQALIGDSSDNIPGLQGVGPKTASVLLKEYATLEELEENINKVPVKIRGKIEGKIDEAKLFRELTRLKEDCTPFENPDEIKVNPPKIEDAISLLEQYELRTTVRELASMHRSGFFSENGGLKAKEVGETLKNKIATNSSNLLTNFEQPKTQKEKNFIIPEPELNLTTKEQASLFELSRELTPNYHSLKTINDLKELPQIDQTQNLILVSTKDNGYIIAQNNWIFTYNKPLNILVEQLLKLVPHAKNDQKNDRENTEQFKIITADLKQLYHDAELFTQFPSTQFFDLGLAAYLINPEERDYSWETLLKRNAPLIQPELTSDLNTLNSFIANLYTDLKNRLHALNLLELMQKLEQPLVAVLFKMEKAGVKIRPEAFKVFLDEVQNNLDTLTNQIYQAAGQNFNIRSSQQLGDILYEKLKLPKAGKTKGGQASTAQESLERLSEAHPIVEMILEYRTLEKLRSTYLEPLPKLADKELRIHTHFNQKATATGRLSSSDPNLQNIPIRGKFGERMRACFGAKDSCVLVSADYSQVELRILAHLSQDPTLLEAFRNNEDIHQRTAGVIFEKDKSLITPDERRAAKTINFGLIYGMGAQKLAKELKISMADAKRFIERYFVGLKRLKTFYQSIEDEAKENGFVCTMTGRRRLTPEINSQNSQVASQARRQAINTRIQGSAADIIKLAMLAVEQDSLLKELNATLILQIHDELILEVPKENAEKAGQRLAELMSNIAPNGEKLSIPLLVEWGTGEDWSKAH